MTASAIYAATVSGGGLSTSRSRTRFGCGARHSRRPRPTPRGNFVIATVPDGKFFVHVTRARRTPSICPAGTQPAELCRRPVAWPAMTIKAVEPSVGGSAVHRQLGLSGLSQGQAALAADGAQARVDGAGGARAACRTSRGTREYAKRARVVSRGRRLHPRHAPRAGRLRRGPRRRQVQAARLRRPARANRARRTPTSICGGTRPPASYFITMVNRLNPQDPNSPAHLEIKLLYGGEVHDQRYIVSVPPGLAERQGWYTVLRYNMTGRDNRLHRERRVWHDYKFYMWWSAGADGRYGTADDVLTAPPVNTNAVQTMCAGCHLTGWERYQDKATGQFLVRAVNDPAGDMNIDDDPAARRDQRRLRELPRSRVGARGQRRPLPLHRQSEAAVGRAVQRDLRPVPRPAAGIRRADQRLHAGDQRDGRAGAARHQPPRADHEVHRPGEEGADDAGRRARRQHLARRRPLEQAASAVRGLPEVEDVPERSDAGGLLGLPRHARRHAVSALAHSRRQRLGVSAVPAMPSGGCCCRTWRPS